MTKDGGSSDPAATPSRPPNRSLRIVSSSHTATATPAASATSRAFAASSRGGFSRGGVLARSRARLIAPPMTSPRRTARPRSSPERASGGATIRSVPKGCRPASDLCRPGPRAPTISPSVNAEAIAGGSPASGRATSRPSLGLPAILLPTATPASYAADVSNRPRGPSPKTSTERADVPSNPSRGVRSPTDPGRSLEPSSRPIASPSGVSRTEAGGSDSSAKIPRASQSVSREASGRLKGWTIMAGAARRGDDGSVQGMTRIRRSGRIVGRRGPSIGGATRDHLRNPRRARQAALPREGRVATIPAARLPSRVGQFTSTHSPPGPARVLQSRSTRPRAGRVGWLRARSARPAIVIGRAKDG